MKIIQTRENARWSDINWNKAKLACYFNNLSKVKLTILALPKMILHFLFQGHMTQIVKSAFR